jgi:hypothetical protein
MDDLPDFAAFDSAYERQLFGPLPGLASTNVENRPRPAHNRSAKPQPSKGPRTNAK